MHQAPGIAGEPVVQGAAVEDLLSLARRAGRCATTCASCCARRTNDYVYFLEFRGRGVFLRASPIDVSQIVREMLLDRRTPPC